VRRSLIPSTSTDSSDCVRFLNWLATICVQLDYPSGADEAQVLLNGLNDGTKLLKVLECVVPGSVNWSKVETQAKSNAFKMLANCEYLLETLRNLGIQCHLITANQISQKNLKALLSLLWIMMREYFRRKHNIVNEDEFNAEADKFIPFTERDMEANQTDCGYVGISPEESPEFELLRPVLFYGCEGDVFTAYHDEASQIDCDLLPEDFSYLSRIPLKSREAYAEKLEHSILHLKTRWRAIPTKKSKPTKGSKLQLEADTQNLPEQNWQTIFSLCNSLRKEKLENKLLVEPSTIEMNRHKAPELPLEQPSRWVRGASSQLSSQVEMPSKPHADGNLPKQSMSAIPRSHKHRRLSFSDIDAPPAVVDDRFFHREDSERLIFRDGSSLAKKLRRKGVVSVRRGYFLDGELSEARGYASGGCDQVDTGKEVEKEEKSYKSAQVGGRERQDGLFTSRFGQENFLFTEVNNHIVELACMRSNLGANNLDLKNIQFQEKENIPLNRANQPIQATRSKSRPISIIGTDGQKKYSVRSNSDIVVGIGVNGPTLLELIIDENLSKADPLENINKGLKIELLKKHHFTRFRVGKDTKPSVPFFLKLSQILNYEGLLKFIKSNRYFVHSRILINKENYQSLQNQHHKPRFLAETKNLDQSTFNFTMDLGSKSQITSNENSSSRYLSLFTARVAIEKIVHALPQDSQSRKTILELLHSLENLIAPTSLDIKTGSCTPGLRSHQSEYLYPPQADVLPTVFATLKHNRLLSSSQRLLIRRAEVIINKAKSQVSGSLGNWTPAVPKAGQDTFVVYNQQIITPLDVSPN
jgi:Calponin homology (CH) domain